MIYWDLFIGFLKVGLFSFGGGYGAVSLIRDVVLEYGWISDDMLSNMIAISESTPGPIMVNLATYVGSAQGGIPGALLATLASIIPAFVIILVVMVGMKSFLENRCVKAVMGGMKSCITGIIFATGFSMILKSSFPIAAGSAWDWKALVILALLLFAYFALPKIIHKKISPILLIGISAVLGMVFYSL